MSGFEILGIAASVLQIADAGARLSTKLFIFTRKIKNADRAISGISQEIAATGAALRELGETLQQDKYAQLGSRHSIDTTNQIVADCWKVFTDINDTIGGDNIIKEASSVDEKASSTTFARSSKPSFSLKQRLKFPYIEPQIMLLKSKLEALKSSLMLMLQILILAEQVRNRPQVTVTEEQRALIQTLIEEREEKENLFRASYLTIEDGGPTESTTEKAVPKTLSGSNAIAASSASSLTLQSATLVEEYPSTPQPVNCFMASATPLTLLPQLPAGTKPEIVTARSLTSATQLTPGISIGEREEPPPKTIPAALRIQQEEIQHHAKLVQNLLQEISDVQYRIDLGIRHRMHDGVLKMHWDEWAQLASNHGHDYFLNTFEKNNYNYLSRYWLDRHARHTIEVKLSSAVPQINSLQKEDRPVLKFTDAISRSFNMPFESCRKWEAMEELLAHTFDHVQGLREAVAQGRYDLIGPEGSIILPRFWEATVEPGMEISMKMWPPASDTAATVNDDQRNRWRGRESSSATGEIFHYRRHSRSRSSSRARPWPTRSRSGSGRREHQSLGLGAAALAAAAMPAMRRGRTTRQRSVSRYRSRSRGPRSTSADTPGRDLRSVHSRPPRDEIATGMVEYGRSKSRTRSRSRSGTRSGVPIVAAGLGNAAIAGLYEKRKDKENIEGAKPFPQMPTLTDEETEELTAAFSVFDTSGDGKISITELGNMMRSLGEALSESEQQAMLQEFGQLERIDFSDVLHVFDRTIGQQDTDDETREAFKVADVQIRSPLSATDENDAMEGDDDHPKIADTTHNESRILFANRVPGREIFNDDDVMGSALASNKQGNDISASTSQSSPAVEGRNIFASTSLPNQEQETIELNTTTQGATVDIEPARKALSSDDRERYYQYVFDSSEEDDIDMDSRGVLDRIRQLNPALLRRILERATGPEVSKDGRTLDRANKQDLLIRERLLKNETQQPKAEATTPDKVTRVTDLASALDAFTTLGSEEIGLVI